MWPPIATSHIQRAQHRVLQWPLEVGDCIAFHGLTVHGAPANASLPMALILLERHPLGRQAFMPLSQLPYLVVVAPPADASRPDLARLRCFAAGPGQGVNYAAGTWHHPLLALQAECDFLVVDRGGAASDHNCDEFALDGLDLWLAAALPA